MALVLTHKEAADVLRRRGWHEARFDPFPTKVEVACAECERAMWLPRSKVGLYLRCSPECSSAARRRAQGERRRSCETCAKSFVPRPAQVRAGTGRFCSQACNRASQLVITSPEVLAKAQAARRAAVARGDIVFKTGPDHHSWRGGDEARRQRLADSGVQAARLRAYRAKNPHKVREFNARRSSRKLGRLPRGAVQGIGDAQRWKCAICRTSIRRAYHLDHVVPLARGGEHARRNLQLLCQPCNLRKNAKDPIDYMRSLGRLL